jgi:hypothetical protein
MSVKTYTIKEALGIIYKAKRGDPKTSLFRETDVPAATVRGWMKEEDMLGLLTYFSYFENIKAGLWDLHAFCVSLNPLPPN